MKSYLGLSNMRSSYTNPINSFLLGLKVCFIVGLGNNSLIKLENYPSTLMSWNIEFWGYYSFLLPWPLSALLTSCVRFGASMLSWPLLTRYGSIWEIAQKVIWHGYSITTRFSFKHEITWPCCDEGATSEKLTRSTCCMYQVTSLLKYIEHSVSLALWWLP